MNSNQRSTRTVSYQLKEDNKEQAISEEKYLICFMSKSHIKD